ncbi:hypothetical protein QQF64_023683 [Cirrhinus molitorella]|uniref:Uncharacterized protein n=1 Tax=Cirrhinus molitorella TaxID=172907 RepID=A0ABR3NJ93_9TELE
MWLITWEDPLGSYHYVKQGKGTHALKDSECSGTGQVHRATERGGPLDIAVFNPLKTAFSTMASRMGLVRRDIVVGKKQFSALLKHVYPTTITAENIKAEFRKAGIFPLSRAAVDTTQVVRVLPSADGNDATSSSAPATLSATPSCAPTTHSSTPSSTQPNDTFITTQITLPHL